MNVLTKQHRIAETAKRWPNEPLTSLNHYLDMDWLREACRRVRKDSAPGHDGQTVEEYGERLDENLADLLERAKSGRYVAPPVRRVHIPKGTGKETRPIGIPTTEDKVLQRAVTMLIEPIYEAEFHDFSFGFRPGRSAHQALDYLWHQTMSQGTKWIIDLDIRKCFDTLSHGVLRQLLQQRVRDGVINRLVGKWLKAGVLEAGRLQYPEHGTPQGGVISPLLSNIYLHEVLDKWFVGDVLPRLDGRAFMVRYADDAVLGFESKADAERVLRVLPKRFEKYGLQLHPEKTRLLPFGRPPRNGPPSYSAHWNGPTCAQLNGPTYGRSTGLLFDCTRDGLGLRRGFLGGRESSQAVRCSGAKKESSSHRWTQLCPLSKTRTCTVRSAG